MKKSTVQRLLRNALLITGSLGVFNAVIVLVLSIVAVVTGEVAFNKVLVLVSGLEIITSIVFIVLVIGYIKKRIADPVTAISQAVDKICVGDYNVNLKLETGLEFDRMAFLFTNIAVQSEQRAGFIQKIADGDFTQRIDATHHDAISTGLNTLSESINDAFNAIYEGATEVNSGGEQVSAASMTLSQGAAEQASTLEELSASINEVRTAVIKNAENADAAYKNAEEAAKEVESGTVKMNELLKAMDDISRSTDEIAKFIKVIEDIAFQTNILALNSSVEAARAGEAGKGFAVVATEVKNLATKSQEAAQQTNKLIQSCVSSVKEGVEKTNETARSFEEIAEKTEEISRGLNVISDACNHQSEAITQINTGVEQISGVVQNTSATAEQCAASAEQLTNRSNMLRGTISRFKFSGEVKPAAKKVAAQTESRPNPVHRAEPEKPAAKPAEPVRERAVRPAHVPAKSYANAEFVDAPDSKY